jgi:hypothetical protein
MLRRLLLITTIALVASACEYTEILRIGADGTAVPLIEFDLVPGESPLPFGLEWTSLEEQTAGFTNIEAADREEIRNFVVDLFVLDDDDPAAAEISESLVMEADGDQLHISFDLPPIDLLSDDEADFGLLLFQGALAERFDDGSFSLSTDARARATEFVTSLYALQGDPFALGSADNPDTDTVPLTMTAELQLPGSIGENDAHARDGDTLRWSWTVGQDGAPGLSVRWDPATGPDDNAGSSPFRLLAILLLGSLAAMFIGFLAASFGLFEALRDRRRDRREFG